MTVPVTLPIKVLMVCLGNICRSPTAEGVLRKLIQEQGLQQFVEVDSAGTSDWHHGEGPDARTVRAANKRGYELEPLRSRQVTERDFVDHHYILAMDAQNLRDLQAICPPLHRSKLGMLLQYGDTGQSNVPDPYQCTLAAFEEVLDLCEQACAAFLQHLVKTHDLPAQRGKP
ncbi:MAG: low molecular weight protein-tyrosine-phosphatase [Pseudomonadota bacterium]